MKRKTPTYTSPLVWEWMGSQRSIISPNKLLLPAVGRICIWVSIFVSLTLYIWYLLIVLIHQFLHSLTYFYPLDLSSVCAYCLLYSIPPLFLFIFCLLVLREVNWIYKLYFVCYCFLHFYLLVFVFVYIVWCMHVYDWDIIFFTKCVKHQHMVSHFTMCRTLNLKFQSLIFNIAHCFLLILLVSFCASLYFPRLLASWKQLSIIF